jgi:hypothetical protein
LSPETFKNHCGIDIRQISAFNCNKPTKIIANTPYIFESQQSAFGKTILSQLSPMPVSRELTNLSLSYGGDNIIALAEISAKLKDYNIGLMGASTSVYANRIGGFAGAVKDYQFALMEYRQAITSNSTLKTFAKQKAHIAFQKLQRQFQNELNLVTAQVKARRGLPLTNIDRATNIARDSRNIAKLNITSQVQANNLVKFAKHAKFLGNGLAVIDFGTRVGNIHNSYQAEGDWERDLFIESSSFAASAITGTAVVNAGGAALGFLMVATPVGWVGLIVGGVAVVGVAAYSSIRVNSTFKENGGAWYDSIMSSLGVK